MLILLSNHALNHYGGSETWTRTMFDELSKFGKVHVYAASGNTVFPDMPPFDPAVSYDRGILNHKRCLTYLREHANIDRIIYTSHGVIPGAERPTEGADVYVAVSEEVQDRLAQDGYESVVIRNPIDLSRFTAKTGPRPNMKNVLWLSNNPRSKEKLIRGATKGMRLKIVGREGQLRDVRPAIKWADLVIALGRSAYESMAMKRNVIVLDYKGADGFVTPETMLELRKANCSGRRYGENWNIPRLVEEFGKYDSGLGDSLRSYIAENNNVETIAEQYLCL